MLYTCTWCVLLQPKTACKILIFLNVITHIYMKSSGILSRVIQFILLQSTWNNNISYFGQWQDIGRAKYNILAHSSINDIGVLIYRSEIRTVTDVVALCSCQHSNIVIYTKPSLVYTRMTCRQVFFFSFSACTRTWFLKWCVKSGHGKSQRSN